MNGGLAGLERAKCESLTTSFSFLGELTLYFDFCFDSCEPQPKYLNIYTSKNKSEWRV